jgi:glyoxylase-like metal-dependent hydrolase (beta-lactamase superfamily II)
VLQVAGRAYADTEGKNGGNIGAVVLDEEIVMIDTGIAHIITAKVRDFLSERFSLPIRKVVFTHSHSDHVFGAQAFETASLIGSMRMADSCHEALKHDWNLSEIREYASQTKDERPDFWTSVQNLQIRTPDILFTNEIVVGRPGDITVRHVGGHTADSSIVIVEPEHICFSGDLLFCGSFPYAGDPTASPDVWIKNLEVLQGAHYQQIIPGHGHVCGNDEVARHLDFFKSLRINVKKALKQGLSADQFIEKSMVPRYYTEGADRRVESTVNGWFKFYGKS